MDKYYIGETVDFKERLKQHNSGFYSSSFTSQIKDWEEVLMIECCSRIQSRKTETHIKKMKSKVYIQNILKCPEIIQKLLTKYK